MYIDIGPLCRGVGKMLFTNNGDNCDEMERHCGEKKVV